MPGKLHLFFFSIYQIPRQKLDIPSIKACNLKLVRISYLFTFDMVPFLLAIILLCFFVKWLNLVIKCILCAQDSYVGI